MKEYKIDHFQDLNKRSKKSKRPKTKGFGYQVLGFGAGGGVSRDPYDIEFLIVDNNPLFFSNLTFQDERKKKFILYYFNFLFCLPFILFF